MSGFEVVGVVLALFPIVVTSVRGYKHVRSGQSLEHLIKDILAEQIIFRSWIGHLLMPTVPMESLIDMLDPASAKFGHWQDPGLQSAIERSFGVTTTAFLLMTLKDIHSELTEIKKALRYVANKEGAASRFGHDLQTMRHTRDGSTVRERLRRLQQLNTKLGQVVAVPKVNAGACSPLMPTREWLPSLSYDHPGNVYQAIKKSYQCDCTRPHKTKLRLPPLQRTRRKDATVSSLLFSVDDSDEEHGPEQALPRLPSSLSPPESDASLVSPVRPAEDGDAGASLPSPPTRSLSSEMSQSFSELSLVGSNMSTNTTISRFSGSRGCLVSVVECTNQSAEQIVDLCKTIRNAEPSTSARLQRRSIGALPPVGCQTYELISEQADPSSTTHSMTSLEDIFTSVPSKLARGLRIELAVRLSIAVLQLCMTPWLDRAWSWKNFSVTAFQGGQQDTLSLFLEHQFYSQRSTSAQPVISDGGHEALMMLRPGEPVLTRLGFALIELAFGERLLNMQRGTQETGGDAHYRELVVASNLMESGQLLHEEGKRYHQAVWTCLKQEVRSQDGHGKKSLNLQDPAFQQDAAAAILRPLVALWMAECGDDAAQNA